MPEFFKSDTPPEGNPYEGVRITTNQEVRKQEDGCWVARLSVECWPEQDDIVPYRWRIESYGVFELREGVVPEDKVEGVVANNASAVLYAWCRDTLRHLTSMGPYNSVELPMLFFVQEDEQPPTKATPAAKPKSRPKKLK